MDVIGRAWSHLAGTKIGDRLPLPVGFDTREFTVVGIVDQGFFFFQPAIYVDLSAWQDLVYQGRVFAMPGTLSNLLVLPPLTIAIVATDFIGDRGTLVLVPTTGGVLFALERTLRSGV